MTALPCFAQGDDPGASFVELLRRTGTDPFPHDLPVRVDAARVAEVMEHGARGDLPGTAVRNTTVLAVEYDGGVVVAGDRRMTAGNLIRQRDTNKVFPADRHSAIAIAGAAGPAFQMVKLFQLQLDYYQKLQDRPLTLEGKANQLATMVQQNLPQAMQGLAVVPLFAGLEPADGSCGLFEYDVTGGRYEKREYGYAVSGSGSMHAGTVLSMRVSPSMSEADALDTVAHALSQAAQFDSATAGPDPARGLYPTMAVVDAAGYRSLDDDAAAAVFAAVPVDAAVGERGRS
ncbi:MAG TPA: proteasome subunit beta [Acidimicrobiaceae bacterium]|nr:proteasome subunit beta [Acidimicrobiaceae bacterium]HCB37934.1 proteasome subunit beta [Acidimicrobiaceae bacterium]